MSRRGRDFIDDRDYVDVRVRDREQERDRDPLARYFQEDRRSEPGALVLRQRDVETVERPRPRPRSPSPAHYREVSYARSVSPMPPPREREVDRVEVRERERQYREPSRERVEIRERERQYREPSRERVVTRVVERERERSPTPSPDRDRIRIVERSRVVSPSPSPSPPPPAPRQVIRGPVVEREVITHYTDVDHGVVYAPQPPPPPPPQPVRERDTEIDIYSSRRHTEVDIHESTSRERRRSRSRSRLRLPPTRSSDKEVTVRSDRNRLEVDIDDHRNRRSRSAQPAHSDRRYGPVAEEARYIESRIDQRGEIGEAYHGATRDWTIVDVPPGTERVRMDGAGGGSADVSWQRYNGVRRTRFIPERDDDVVVAPRQKVRQVVPDRERGSRDHINVQITDQGRGRDREIEVETDRRMVKFPPPAPRELVPAASNDMWTEITKDLVSREAMDQLGYDYNETEYFYYILEYLRYEDVQELVQLSDRIRKYRRKHRQSRDDVDVDVDVVHRRRRSHSHHRPRREDERVFEREVVVDRHLHPTYYR
ncbi:glutamic acid rich protein [Ophiostoma piceae UAMH 11346]|uniref:Glutamic acid rich protein n=1 Tax=Ophiostoma piceae (strain UAMH 11346) TaxID=1262450 RepID=S3BVL4_OPHP1|nr:glutamic acid rich protein [Ophiostoma piceae UAMH 11346]